MVSYVNCATSMGGRFSIFSVVGLMAHTLGREVAQRVVSSSKITNKGVVGSRNFFWPASIVEISFVFTIFIFLSPRFVLFLYSRAARVFSQVNQSR